MTTAETLARFHAEYQIPQSISHDRQAQQMRELQKLAASIDKPLINVTQQDVLNFLGAKLTAGTSPNTVRNYHNMVRSFVTWGIRAGLIEEERGRLLKLITAPRGSSAHSRPNPYSMTEVRQFRAALAEKYPYLPEYGKGSRLLTRYLQGKTDRMHTALWRHARRLQFEAQVGLTLELGLRAIEMYQLTLKAAHYENDMLVVRTAKQDPGAEKFRQIPWTPNAHRRMQEWIDFRSLLSPDHDSLWLVLTYQYGGQHQIAPQSHVRLKKSIKALGPQWRWHRFRHTAATEWLRAGMPLEKVRLLLGHARIEQTLAYTQIVNADISSAMDDALEQFTKRMGLSQEEAA